MEGRTREGRGDRRETEKVVIFGTYNIRSGRNGGLESALHGLVQGQVDCGMLQETKITDIVYTWASSGFWVTATAALSAHCGGIAVFYREAEHFGVEELRLHGPNVLNL